MFRVKICGITSVDDALSAADAGADAIGLNFYPGSRRHVDAPTAFRIAEAVGERLQVVGVFVNSPLDEIVGLTDRLPLDLIQLHGDEPAELVVALAPRKVIRAFRLRTGEERALTGFVAQCEQLGAPLAAVLVDAYQPGTYGGTGKLANLGQIREVFLALSGVKVVLAGGLDPDNVRQAILATRCHAVDVASGVENDAGSKDRTKMRDFVRAAREALSEGRST